MIYIYIYIHMTLKSLNIMRIDVKFSWTPAHTGINGNEIADQLAKKATKKKNIEIEDPVGRGEIKSIMKSYIQKKWQKKWDTADTGIFYYKINSSVNDIYNFGRCKDEVILKRLQFGHRTNKCITIQNR